MCFHVVDRRCRFPIRLFDVAIEQPKAVAHRQLMCRLDQNHSNNQENRPCGT